MDTTLSCTKGDDQSCITLLGDDSLETTCCMKLELESIDIPSTGDSNMDAMIADTFTSSLSTLGFPSKEGEAMWMCTPDWQTSITEFDTAMKDSTDCCPHRLPLRRLLLSTRAKIQTTS